MQLSSRLHDRLAASQTVVGAADTLNTPIAAEALVHFADLDFFLLDLQHTPVHVGEMVNLLRAVQGADPGIFPFARLPNHDVYWIQQTLDAGYLGLVVPLCESAEQAAAMAEVTYYPPRGSRSKAGGIRATLYDDYFDRADDQIVLLPQIESARGLENVEQIAAVEGVTGLLIGPLDLSLSCGWAVDEFWTKSPGRDAVARIKAACDAHHKPLAAITAGDSVFAAQSAGVQIISVASDAGFIRGALAGDVASCIERLRDA